MTVGGGGVMTFVRNGSGQGVVGELLLHCVGKLGIRNLEHTILLLPRALAVPTRK